VKESFQGKTVWDGIVEVFDLKGHPTAFRIYAWAHDTDDPDNPRRHVTVLHAHPVKSPPRCSKGSNHSGAQAWHSRRTLRKSDDHGCQRARPRGGLSLSDSARRKLSWWR